MPTPATQPRHSRARGFFIPLSPPKMNCLENDETDQYAAAQSGCHGPARRAPPLFGFDIRRNMPHTGSLTPDVMLPRHTFQECQDRSIRPPALLPQAPQCRPLTRERTNKFPRIFPPLRSSVAVSSTATIMHRHFPIKYSFGILWRRRNEKPRRALGDQYPPGLLSSGWHATKHSRYAPSRLRSASATT